MSKRKCLVISAVITTIMTLAVGIITLAAALGGSDDPDLAEGLGRALIMIFGIITLIYLGATLLFKLLGIAFQNKFLTAFIALTDIAGGIIIAVFVISSITESNDPVTVKFILELRPFTLPIIAELLSAYFDIKSIKSKK